MTTTFQAARPFEFLALFQGENPRAITLRAEPTGDPGIYQEIAVQARVNGKTIADILIGLNERGEVRVLTTSQGEEEHKLAIYPERPYPAMVEQINL